jgi:hypothetical protein
MDRCPSSHRPNRYIAGYRPLASGSLTRANKYIHISVEQRDVVQQALAGEAVELVVFQFEDVRLGDAEFAGGCGLGHAFGFARLVRMRCAIAVW